MTKPAEKKAKAKKTDYTLAQLRSMAPDALRELAGEVPEEMTHEDLVNQMYFGDLDLKEMSKEDLIALGKDLGLFVNDTMTELELVRAINAVIPAEYQVQDV